MSRFDSKLMHTALLARAMTEVSTVVAGTDSATGSLNASEQCPTAHEMLQVTQ